MCTLCTIRQGLKSKSTLLPVIELDPFASDMVILEPQQVEVKNRRKLYKHNSLLSLLHGHSNMTITYMYRRFISTNLSSTLGDSSQCLLRQRVYAHRCNMTNATFFNGINHKIP